MPPNTEPERGRSTARGSSEQFAGGHVGVEIGEDFVATVELRRPPNNYFDATLLHGLADALDELERDERCRTVVLASEGKHFCAGAELGGAAATGRSEPSATYEAAVRLLSGTKPIVAAIKGAAIGGGLGLAMTADFRIGSPESRFTANFAQLGFFPGFGLTVTLPRIVGEQATLDLLYTGRRVGGEEAFALGLCDRLVASEDVRSTAHELAATIAMSAPQSVQRLRRHLRGALAEAVRVATHREREEQVELATSADFKEGVAATAERRPPRFTGR